MTSRVGRTTFVAAAFVLAALARPSAEWFQWRGADRTGVSNETGLLTQWPPSGPPVAWTRDGLGDGYGSLSISGDHLFVQVSSFDLKEGPGGWAIPMAYEAKDDPQRVRKLLGFDEGWEDAAPECLLVCDAAWRPFWRDVMQRKRFGLTVAGGQSLYPNKIGDRESAPLAAYVGDQNTPRQ